MGKLVKPAILKQLNPVLNQFDLVGHHLSERNPARLNHSQYLPADALDSQTDEAAKQQRVKSQLARSKPAYSKPAYSTPLKPHNLVKHFLVKPIPLLVFGLFSSTAYAQNSEADIELNRVKQCKQQSRSAGEESACLTNGINPYHKTQAVKDQASKGQFSENQFNQNQFNNNKTVLIAGVPGNPIQSHLIQSTPIHNTVSQNNHPQLQLDTHIATAVDPIQLADAGSNYGNTGISVSPEIIRTAEATDSQPAPSNTPNKINTPDKSINSRTMNAKEGKDLPLSTDSKDPKAPTIKLDEVQVRAKRFYEIGPLPGLGLTKEQIPGNVQSITAKEIKESHSLSLTDLLNKKLQSVNVNDYQGNPFQMDVTYRGFTAGPQIGTPQGLSVFLDGIRVNEPFGDVVNWDMIPMNAIAGVDVFPGSNPIFGLNTLGGAFTLKTKDGFSNEGVDAEILAGSYGRKQLQVEGGWNNGTVALFGAGNFFMEDGWRDNSPSKVNQAFGKASYRGDKLDLSLSTLLVQTDLVGNGLLPSEEYKQDPTSVFTSPDTTKNKLAQFQLSSSYFVNDNFTVTGQVYRRDSKRHAIGADAFTDYGGNGEEYLLARRRPGINAVTGEPEQYTCLLTSTNTFGYKIPDYYLVPINVTAGEDPFITGSTVGNFYEDYFDNGNIDNSTGNNANFNTLFNAPITTADGLPGTSFAPNYPALFEQDFNFQRNFFESQTFNRNTTPIPQVPTFIDPFGNFQTAYGTGGGALEGAFRSGVPGENIINPFSTDQIFFYSTAGNGDLIKNIFVLKPPINSENCISTQATNVGAPANRPGGPAFTYADANGNIVFVDGAGGGTDANGNQQPGVVEGTPTAIINDNQIDQITDGGSIQFNWNFEQHKFMVGASIDAASAEYSNTSQLGFLDANRKAYLDPAQASPQFAGAFEPLSNNDFEGTNTTKSIYFSETWTPVETWNFSASGRYNETQTKNKIAARYGRAVYGISDLLAIPDNFNLCPNGDCSNVSTNYRLPLLDSPLDKAETEKFSYYSFNPSLGATWQAKENLNLFINWAQGTRTPSVIELGCAFDKTPVQTGMADTDGDGITDTPVFTPKSLAENRQCTLPTTLSGDPYLPQIKATTYDVGARGTFSNVLGATDIQWNLGAYQTDLKDDIYFIAAGANAGFFDSIGKTRRRGLEAGLSGKKDKWGFSLNYGLTDATFQDNFKMYSFDNSSTFVDSALGAGTIQVKKGNRMPGVPLHNLNASISYEVTPQWQVGLTAVAHSESFVRGNENNKHKVGVIQDRGLGPAGNALLQPTSNPGTVPAYAVFNLQTSYKFNKTWTGTMLVSNLFDKEYFSAGRLGRNPFSPSINGAIGPDGYNHNSNDWLSTNFISPGAPRGVWFSLNYQFVPDKKF